MSREDKLISSSSFLWQLLSSFCLGRPHMCPVLLRRTLYVLVLEVISIPWMRASLLPSVSSYKTRSSLMSVHRVGSCLVMVHLYGQRLTLCTSDEVQARWAFSAGNDGNTSTSKLPIRFVRNGAIIVPGMTGARLCNLLSTAVGILTALNFPDRFTRAYA